MSPAKDFDRDYCDRLETAIWAAIRHVSLAADGAIVMRNHEVVTALTGALAAAAATSTATDTPLKLRAFSHAVAADLVRRIQSARRG